jgi:transposase
MISYEQFCQIHDLHQRQALNAAQISRILNLDHKTVATWLARPHFISRATAKRNSLLDPFKGTIAHLLNFHPYSAQQIYQRLIEEGYVGSLTLVRDHVRQTRPVQRPVYLKLHFSPGECAQVDWGEFSTIAVGNTRRRLSFFVMVLAYSRMIYIEFTVSQTMEHFLACHEHAFHAFGGVPTRIMVDNLKSAVLSRLVGESPVFNPKYLDFARHYGFDITACNVAKGNEKGRVESGVGYVKKNFLNGRELKDFQLINPAAKLWLDTIANVRCHGETRQRPCDLFLEEKPHLRPLNSNPYDYARTLSLVANSQFRFTVDTNHYSVPADYAHRRLTIKVHPDRLCAYYDGQLIARHVRCYDRHQDLEQPDHAKVLVSQRHHAREQRLVMNFLALSSQAPAFYEGLQHKQLNTRHHLRRILALAEIYPAAEMDRAIQDGLAFRAFSADYITNILEMRSRALPEPGPLHLTRHQDLLEIDIPPPDLSLYEEQSP